MSRKSQLVPLVRPEDDRYPERGAAFGFSPTPWSWRQSTSVGHLVRFIEFDMIDTLVVNGHMPSCVRRLDDAKSGRCLDQPKIGSERTARP